jgi:two-component system, NarL family, response regulator LiaR
MTTRGFALEARPTPGDPRFLDAAEGQAARFYPSTGRDILRILIANHQPIVRHGLRALMAKESDLQVIGETDDGWEAVHMARQLRPHVVLVDLSIRNLDGISTTREIRSALRDTQVIVMTDHEGHASAIEAVRAGAAAYILSDFRIDDLLRTIRGAGGGQVALPAQTAARMVRLVEGHEVLSRRETEVLILVARGMANKGVARELGVTESTVKTHVSGILSKLGLSSRAQLVIYAIRSGLMAVDRAPAGSRQGD